MLINDRIRNNNLLSAYGALLTDKQRTILKEYYELDLSLFEIAEQYGITRQAVRDTVVKATAQLIAYESKLMIVAKRDKLIQAINKMVFCDKCKKNVDELKELSEE